MPIMLIPAAVDNGVPEEADIEQAVRGLKGGKEGQPIRNAGIVSKWVVLGGLAVEKPGEETVETVSEDNSEEV